MTWTVIHTCSGWWAKRVASPHRSRLSKGIPSAFDHGRSLRDIARIIDLDRAEAVASAIEDEFWRVRAWAAVALAAVGAGATERAARMAAAAGEQIREADVDGWPWPGQLAALATAVAAMRGYGPWPTGQARVSLSAWCRGMLDKRTDRSTAL